MGRNSKTSLPIMISVVVPCYNCEKTIRRAVDSLLNQKTDHNDAIDDYEIVLVDDGSNDGTSGVCDEYAEIDRRVSVIHQDNKGLMRAWKNGVLHSVGEYIVFCDSDDYVDSDLIEKLSSIIKKYHTQLILYGMYEEYDNGDTVKILNRLEEGYFNRKEIEECVLPNLLSDGRMQSELISKCRCNKSFEKKLLLGIIDELPDHISFSEDDITTLAAVINSKSIFCMGDYCPYHYVRNAESMIGGYDPEIFNKIDLVYTEMRKIAEKYNYQYEEQILQDRLSTTLLFMKKEISRNPEGRRGAQEVLMKVRMSDGFRECTERCSVERYAPISRWFAKLMINGFLTPAFIIVSGYEKIRGRNT